VTTLVIDESGDDLGDSHRYVIGAGVLLPAAGELDEVRSNIERLLTLTPNRSRPFHWLNEGPVLRSAIIVMIGHLDLQVYAVIGSTPARHAIELVREECLREVFRSVREHEVERIVIESRERSTRVVGQNRRDFGTLIDARHAGDLSPSVAYEWVPKDEPLVWLADAVAGAVLASERGEVQWLRMIGQAARTVVIRLPS